jgi:Cu/Ag efflux protein CusF
MKAHSIIFRRHQLLLLCGYSVSRFTGRSNARPLTTDFIAREVVRIDAERGEVRLRYKPIAHLHLPARPTVFHYVDARAIVRTKAGNAFRFRADRFEGTLYATAILPSGIACPASRPTQYRRIQLSRSEST